MKASTMKKIQKTRKRTLVQIVIIAVLLSTYYFFFSFHFPFSDIVNHGTQKSITRIEAKAGFNGQVYEASSEDEISGFWKILNTYKFKRIWINPKSNGYLFGGAGYTGDAQSLTFSISDGIWINGKHYKPSSDKIYREIKDYIEQGGFHKGSN